MYEKTIHKRDKRYIDEKIAYLASISCDMTEEECRKILDNPEEPVETVEDIARRLLRIEKKE